MATYTVTYWTGRVEYVRAETAHDAALTIWPAEYLYRYSIDAELLDTPDTMEILSAEFSHVATIVKASRVIRDGDCTRQSIRSLAAWADSRGPGEALSIEVRLLIAAIESGSTVTITTN